ncbi:MAG TPA: hypothetical protein VMV34_01380 [Terriglobia bacterium]|nr:hypothetical protein [Terriglobia bacterium]
MKFLKEALAKLESREWIRRVLHLSTAWGGLGHRTALFARLLTYFLPTSPKLGWEPIS